MVAANKTLTVAQNGSKWSFEVPYTGVVPEGWVHNVKGYWYQFADGSWAVGWKKIEGKWYYFDADGYRVHGWAKVNGYWYWLDPTDGVMLTGWLDYKGKRCYLDASGKALCNCTVTIGGKTYKFDAECYATETDGTEQIPSVPVIHQNPNFKGYNVSKRSDPIMYIVIHYTGAEGTAKNNVDYFNGGNRNASADFFVGQNGEIWQYNPDLKRYYSWHCGGGRQSSKGGTFYGKCKNGNSVGIELCTHKHGDEWIFYDATIEAARILVKYLMEEYGVKQANIIRHWDVNGKNCPAVYGYAGDNAPKWDKFKASLSESTTYDDRPQMYRVRKSWKEADTQKGAFAVLENAKACARTWGSDYHVFDNSGIMIM
jgi:N-acetyl-anhydromuramyl-L-alanine amidase AmpD